MDAISREIVRLSLLAYGDEMTKNFWRSSYGYMNYEVRDFAVGFVDPEGRIIVQSRFTHPRSRPTSVCREAAMTAGRHWQGDVLL
jgi:N-methylhydantoinase B